MPVTYVFDTSSLSHAIEPMSSAFLGAFQYDEDKRPRSWSETKARFRRRSLSGLRTRSMLLKCDSYSCAVPVSVKRELLREVSFRDSVLLLFGKPLLVEDKYKRIMVRGKIDGFSKVFRIELKEIQPKEQTRELVRKKALEIGMKIGGKDGLSEADIDGVALALDLKAVLVTADNRQYSLAKALGVPAIKTI